MTTLVYAGVKFMCLRFSSIASGASKPAPTSAVNLKEIHERVVFFRRLFLAKVERGEHEVRLTPRDDEALERLLLSQELVQREVLLVAQLLVANVKHGGDLIVLDVIDAEDELFLPRRVQARELLARVLVVLVLQHDFTQNDENASVKRKKKRAGGVGSAVETFLARAEKLVEPIQAPDVSGDEIDRDGGGLNAWVAAHRRKRPGSAQAVTASIDAWFEKKEAEEAAAEEAANAVKSDDGWTKVEAKRGRRKTTEESTGTTIGSIRAATADRRRKEPKKIAGEQFYRFQSKEKKRNEIIELQAKFEQDKQRIARLKAARKFRPM